MGQEEGTNMEATKTRGGTPVSHTIPLMIVIFLVPSFFYFISLNTDIF